MWLERGSEPGKVSANAKAATKGMGGEDRPFLYIYRLADLPLWESRRRHGCAQAEKSALLAKKQSPPAESHSVSRQGKS